MATKVDFNSAQGRAFTLKKLKSLYIAETEKEPSVYHNCQLRKWPTAGYGRH